MNKASRGGGIAAELFHILKDDAVKVLHSMCQQIQKTQWPQDWKRFIPIPKKDSAKEFHPNVNKCSNYCTAAAAAKSLQSYLTLCDPIDGNSPGSSVPWILQASILEWVAISSPMHACMLSHLVVSDSLRPHGQQPTSLLHQQDCLGKNTGVGCHFLPFQILQDLKE